MCADRRAARAARGREPVPSPRPRTLGPRCARSWSRTCTRRRSARRSARSCATRSRRCGGAATSRSSCSPSRRGSAATRAPRASCAGASRGARFDVVHAHFGLTAWPAVAARLGPVVVTLHGNDLFHPRSNRLTRAILPFTALPAAVSREFSGQLPGAGTTPARGGAAGGDRPRALPPDPARRGARAARARPARALPAVPARPVAAAEALRPRAGGRRRDGAAHAWAASRPPTSRSGSTPPTPCSSRRRPRGSGCR